METICRRPSSPEFRVDNPNYRWNRFQQRTTGQSIRQSSWTQLPVSNNRLNGLYTSICLGHRQLFSRFGGIGERHKISHRDLCINNNKVSVCSVDGASSCGLNGPGFELVAESLSVVTSIRTQVSHLDGRQTSWTPPLVSPIIA